MSYATSADLETRFGLEELTQLTDRATPPAGGPDAEAVQAALDDATETIDGYAAARYATPLSPVPAPVRRWCADMARYYLYVALGPVPEAVRTAYEDAVAGLKDMARGAVVFQCAGVVAANAPGGGAELQAPRRVFTDRGLKGF